MMNAKIMSPAAIRECDLDSKVRVMSNISSTRLQPITGEDSWNVSAPSDQAWPIGDTFTAR